MGVAKIALSNVTLYRVQEEFSCRATSNLRLDLHSSLKGANALAQLDF